MQVLHAGTLVMRSMYGARVPKYIKGWRMVLYRIEVSYGMWCNGRFLACRPDIIISASSRSWRLSKSTRHRSSAHASRTIILLRVEAGGACVIMSFA